VLVSRVKSWISSKRLPRAALIAAFVFALPSLGGGLAMDDLWHRAKITHSLTWSSASSTGMMSLFDFVNGSAEEHRQFVEAGFLPWWVTNELRVSFFRPVSCLTHALDYALWPRTPALMHAQSILWYVALVALVTIAYRRWLPPLAANVATLFYAIDSQHGLPVGWIANRNAIVAAVFAVAALLLWDSRRIWLSALALALALGSGESAVGILPFFFAHWLFLDRRPLKNAVPIIVVVSVWAVVYKIGNYGAHHSGVYTEPLRAPVDFLENVAAHVPLLLAAELGAPQPDAFPFLGFGAKVALIVVALAVIAWTISILIKRDSKTVRFLAIGAVLSAMPSAATFPSGRLLLLPGIGLVGLVALICVEPIGRSARAFRGLMILQHVLLALPVFLVNEFAVVLIDRTIRHLSLGIPADGSAADKRLVLVNAPDTSFGYYMVVHPLEDGGNPPRKLLVAAGNLRPLHFTRTQPDAFRVREDGGFFADGTELLFCDRHVPFKVGDEVSQGDTRIVITHVLPDGVPDEAEFVFLRPLDEGYVFRQWRGNAIVPFELPPIGSSIDFPADRIGPIL
jgi:hypothetical protein